MAYKCQAVARGGPQRLVRVVGTAQGRAILELVFSGFRLLVMTTCSLSLQRKA